MKVRFYRWYNALLSFLLALVGYGCSSSSDEEKDYPVMYGTWGDTTYNVYGTMMDEDSIPVQGIKATLKHIHPDYPENAYTIDSTQTDSVGNYQFVTYWLGEHTKLIVEDIDGDANGGEFQTDTIDIAQISRRATEAKGYVTDHEDLHVDITLKKKHSH